MTLLIKPLFSLFAYILKLFVAIGYAITANSAMLPADGGAPAQAAVVVQEDSRATMTVTLADGRRFRGLLLPCRPSGADAALPSRQHFENVDQEISPAGSTALGTRPHCPEVATAVLLGAHDELMECFFARVGGTPVARCRTDDGRIFIGPRRPPA